MTDRKDPFFRDPPPREGGGAGGGSGSGGASPRRPSRSVPDDASIPVLTERLTLPPVDLDFTLPVPSDARDATTRSTEETLRDVQREFLSEPAQDPLQDPLRDPLRDSLREPLRDPTRDPLRDVPREPMRTVQPPPADPEEPLPSPFVHFSMNSPVGRSFPAAPTFAPPVPPLQTPPPAAVSLGSGAEALPVPPATIPATAPLPVSPAPISVAASTPATPTISATPTGAHWARIELELRESILRELAARLPLDVEAIVRRHMASALEEAIEAATTALVARVAAEARLALATSLREIVDGAVKAELERLRGLKR